MGADRLGSLPLKDTSDVAPRSPASIVVAISLWHRFAPDNRIDWKDESHKAEYLMAVDDITTGQLFNLLLSRINFDSMDPKTFSLAELQRAIPGAEWPHG